MTDDTMALPCGTGLSSLRDEAATASSPEASIPSAERLVSMVAAYYNMPAKEMRDTFPEYAALDLNVARPMEVVMRFFCQTASAIEARRAETQSGSVHESAAPEGGDAK